MARTCSSRLLFQSASNASNNQTHVQSDLDFSNNCLQRAHTGYGFANALLGVYNSYSQANGKPYQNYLYHDVSFYAQDTWKVNKHLTLDLGIRFSWYQPVHNTAGDGAYFDSPRHTIPPGGAPVPADLRGRLDLLVGRGHLPGRRPGFHRYRDATEHAARLLRGQVGIGRRQP